MKRRVIWLASLGVILAVAAIWLALTREPEGPVYQGKKFSEWYRAAGSTNVSKVQEARRAMVGMGSNAVPYLIHQLRREALKEYWLKKAASLFHTKKFSTMNAAQLLAAHRGLVWLGQNSLPELERTMEESSNREILCEAYLAAEMIVAIQSDSRYSQFPLSSDAVKKVTAAMSARAGTNVVLYSIKPSGK